MTISYSTNPPTRRSLPSLTVCVASEVQASVLTTGARKLNHLKKSSKLKPGQILKFN